MLFDRFLFACIVSLPLLATLPEASAPDWSLLALCTLVFTITGLFFAHRLVKPGYPLTWRRAAWLPGLLLILAAYMGLQTLPLPFGDDLSTLPNNPISLDRFQTRLHALQTLALACYAFLAIQLTNSRHRLKFFAYALVFTGFAQAAYGTFMTLSGIEFGFFDSKTVGRGLATGTYVNRNHFAGLMEICLGLAVGLLVGGYQERSGRWNLRDLLRASADFFTSAKGAIRLASVIMVIALVMTHSRMGNTAFFAALLILGLVYMIARRKLQIGTLVLLGSILLIDIVIVGNWFGLERVMARLQGTEQQIAEQREARVPVSEFNWELGKDHWLTGVGAGAYEAAIPAYMQQDIGRFDHAHNDYLQVWIEHGAIGAGLFALFGLACLRQAYRAMTQRQDKLMIGIGYGSLMASLAIAIHSTTDFNLQIPANALILVALLTLGVIASFPRPRGSHR